MVQENKDLTFLYRVENPNIPAKPDGAVSHEQIIGQWFTPDASTVVQYLKKSLKAPGAQLVVAKIPSSDLGTYYVDAHPIAATMDVEPDNYLVPRDGTVPTTVIPLDTVVQDLNPNNLYQRMEATQRIINRLAELSLLQAPSISE